MHRLRLSIFIVLLAISAIPAQAQNIEIGNAVGKETGLPLPRFVSLKSGEVNMRVGPGVNFPIAWVYKQKSFPVEITAEFGNWRKVKDYKGDEGWILHSLLSGKRTALVLHDSVAYSIYEGDSAVMRFGPGVIVRLRECRRTMCRVQYEAENGKKARGWVEKGRIWGMYDWERFD